MQARKCPDGTGQNASTNQDAQPIVGDPFNGDVVARERVGQTFLDALAGPSMPEDQRMIVCGFDGDPNNPPPYAWRPRPWRPGSEVALPTSANLYVTVGSFGRAADGRFRRRTETFSAGRALMVDDVGTKVTPDDTWPQPSAIIETSPGNAQWWYFLSEPERDLRRFDGVIRAFISAKLLGVDPGMSGVTRVGRVPGYVNGKPKHNGWVVRTQELRPELRYSVQELLDGFGLHLEIPRQRDVSATLVGVEERIRAFYIVLRVLQMHRMLKREEPNLSGWIEMHCPWVQHHTDRADTGAAMRIPAEENGFYGGFKCHHAHCGDRRFRDLTEWIAELAAEELARANDSAPETLDDVGGGAPHEH